MYYFYFALVYILFSLILGPIIFISVQGENKLIRARRIKIFWAKWMMFFVGKDQLQHLEMTRDVASRINHKHGEIFVLSEPILQQDAQLILGTDGEKMSKSRNNTIDVFDTENAIKKLINKNIITDNTPLEEPKDPDSATVYQLFKLLASDEESKTMADKLKAGGYGWGHAKKELLEKVVSSFSEERAKFNHYQNNPKEVEEVLLEGAQKAKKVAKATLDRVRNSLGYN